MPQVQPETFSVPVPDAALFVHEKVLSLLPERPGLILDIPSGEGAFAALAHSHGYKIQCGDIDDSKFKLKIPEFQVVDLNGVWPFKTDNFDSVVCIEGIEHLENPWHFAREARRVLKIKGCLILTTPNILAIKSRLSYLFYGYPNYFHYMLEPNYSSGGELPIDHINPISFLELRHLLTRSGFRIVSAETNRYLKRNSLVSQILKVLIRNRGKTHVKNDVMKSAVRETLLTPELLFGEVLILKAIKI